MGPRKPDWVERIWREEGLQLPQRHKKRKRLYHKDSSVIRLRPLYQNHIWSVDFVHDKLSFRRSYKILTVLDEYTRQALCVEGTAQDGLSGCFGSTLSASAQTWQTRVYTFRQWLGVYCRSSSALAMAGWY